LEEKILHLRPDAPSSEGAGQAPARPCIQSQIYVTFKRFGLFSIAFSFFLITVQSQVIYACQGRNNAGRGGRKDRLDVVAPIHTEQYAKHPSLNVLTPVTLED